MRDPSDDDDGLGYPPGMVPRALLVICVLLTTANEALAHEVGLSRSVWALGDELSVDLTFARPDVLRVVPAADSDGDGVLGASEVNATTVAPLWRDVVVRRGGAPCALHVSEAALVEGDGVAVAGVVDCGGATEGGAGGGVDVTFGFLSHLGGQHRHLAAVLRGDGEVNLVAYADNATITLTSTPATTKHPVSAYLALGVEHILIGYDHLCFLLGLVVVLVVRGRVRSVLAIITAFTLAHSVTLALSALGALSLPSFIVEAVIALSIVVVGIDSWRRPDPRGRWLLSFPFGLIHGFGFAGVLGEIGLPQDAALPALALFNVGVEVGQLAVVAALAPLLWLLRTRASMAVRVVVVRVVSVGIVMAGAFWFIERVIGAINAV